jgi:hypothetical protein
VKKNIWAIYKERTFYPKNCHKALKNIGFDPRHGDLRSGQNLFRIMDPGSGFKKVPDPGSTSATLQKRHFAFKKATQGPRVII